MKYGNDLYGGNAEDRATIYTGNVNNNGGDGNRDIPGHKRAWTGACLQAERTLGITWILCCI